MRTREIFACGLLFLLAGTPMASAQEPTSPGELLRRMEAMERRHQEQMERQREAYEARLLRLEDKAGGLQDRLEERERSEADAILEETINTLLQENQQRGGLGSYGQTTVFDNTFNPALSVVGDFILPLSDKEDSYETLNRFHLREVALELTGRVDPLLSYWVSLHISEEDFELEEAFGLVDQWLPDTFELKFGRYNVDFGKLAILHEHDLPFVDKPQVLQDYLGGSLRGTGVELHHWFGLGEISLLRWSAGVINGIEGDAHSVFGPSAGGHHHHDEEGAEPFGERGIENFAFTGRVSGLFEVGRQGTLQAGASLAWAPEERAFIAPAPADGLLSLREGVGAGVTATDLERQLFGLDMTYVWQDESTGEALTLGGEFLVSHQDFLPEEEGAANQTANVTSMGFYLWTEYAFDREWSLGASGGWFEHAEDDAEESWDLGVFTTWRVNEFNRLRFEARRFDDPEEDYWGAMIQWTVILGAHSHGIDW